jgi:hypothetical protein
LETAADNPLLQKEKYLSKPITSSLKTSLNKKSIFSITENGLSKNYRGDPN